MAGYTIRPRRICAGFRPRERSRFHAPNLSVKLLIVDDHPLFRQGVRSALSSYGDIDVVVDASSGEHALEWLAAAPPNREPTVALVDLNLPGMSGSSLPGSCGISTPASAW